MKLKLTEEERLTLLLLVRKKLDELYPSSINFKQIEDLHAIKRKLEG